MLLISNSTVNLLATTSKIMNTEWFQTFKRAKNLDLRLLLKPCVDWRAETLKPLRSHIHACLVESVSKYSIYVNKRWVCLTIKQYWWETFHFQRCRAQYIPTDVRFYIQEFRDFFWEANQWAGYVCSRLIKSQFCNQLQSLFCDFNSKWGSYGYLRFYDYSSTYPC